MADKTVVVRIALRANQFQSGLKGAAAQTGRFGVDVSKSMEKAGSSALALGAASATAGKVMLLGIGGAMVVSAKAAIDFESSMAGVAKTTDLAGNSFDRASGPLADYAEALRGLSLRIPMNVNELAQISELGGQLGVGVPNLIEFTEVIAALGVSTNLAATEAATGLARFSNIMGTSQDDFDILGSVLVDLGNNFATTESEILGFGLRIAPVGKSVGAREAEILGLAAAMSSLGIPAERGGTAIQRMFIRMSEAIDGGGEKLEMFAQVAGLSSKQFAELFADSPTKALTRFAEGLDLISESGGSVFKTLKDLDIQEQRTVQVLLAAANGWETLESAIDTANEAADENTALFEEAARRYGTTASQIQITANAFNDLRIEIGNLVLGSGGLAAALEVLTEFFSIVKDNIPLIGDFAKVLGIVAGIRFGAFIGTGIIAGVGKFTKGLANARKASSGLTSAMAATRLAALGLNTAMFGLAGIAAILITKWAMASVKAAELRRASRELREELQSGGDVYKTFIGSLEEQGIFTQKTAEALDTLGISQRDYVDALITGRDLLQELGITAEDTEFGLAKIGETQAKLGPGKWDEIDAAVVNYNKSLEDAKEFTEFFFANQKLDLRNSLREAGIGADMTREQMDKLIETAIGIFGIDITNAELVQWLNGDFAEADGLPVIIGSVVDEAQRELKRWDDVIARREGGDEALTEFFGEIEDAAEQFTNDLRKAYEDVNEVIYGGFPVWDEYEQQVIYSLKKVTAAQDDYIEDLKDGLGLEADLVGTVSSKTLEWVQNLDPATKAALARFRETNRTAFDKFIAETEANFDELAEIRNDLWISTLPGVTRAAFAEALAAVQAGVDEFGLGASQASDAFLDGMNTLVALLPAEIQASLRDGFDAEGMRFLFNQVGFELGLAILAGLNNGMISGSAELDPTVRDINERIKNEFKLGFKLTSPSKVMMAYGQDLIRGLSEGMKQETVIQFPSNYFQPLINQLQAMTTAQASTTNNRTMNVTVNNPQGEPGNVRSDVQTALLMSGIAGVV